MARRNMGMSMEKLQKLLGKEFSAGALAEITKQAALPKNTKLNESMMLEATLYTLAYPEKARVVKKCKNEECGEAFYTTYYYVAYCSDYCRRQALASDFGIEVVEKRYRDRDVPDEALWEGRTPPMIIPEAALKVMKFLVETAENHLGRPIEPWSAPEQTPEPKEESPDRNQTPKKALAGDAARILESVEAVNWPKIVDLSEV